jgi:hypothetical protein
VCRTGLRLSPRPDLQQPSAPLTRWRSTSLGSARSHERRVLAGFNPLWLVLNFTVAGFPFWNISIRREQFCSDSPPATGACSTTKGAVSLSGGWQCQSPISSGDMPKKRCFGSLNPKPRKRSRSWLSCCAHGRRRRSRARGLLLIPQ